MRDCDPYNCERCGEPVGEESFASRASGPVFLCGECREDLDKPKVAPAVFLGIQESYGGNPPFCLFNLMAEITGNGYRFVSGSTVTQHSVELAGYTLPFLEEVKAQNAVLNHMAKIRRVNEKEVA